MATLSQIKMPNNTTHDILKTTFFGTCSTAAATAAKVVTISDTTGWSLKAGTIIGVKFTNSNSASSVTLNVNSSGAKSIWYNNAAYTGSSASICGYASRVTYYMYDGTYWVWLNMGNLDGNTDTIPQAQCNTDAATAAKGASMTYYTATAKSYVMVNIRYANTAASAITLNINSTGAKPIYINGSASSASNYTLPAGSYLVYYDGTNYYFRTDGKITGSITGDAATVNGKTVAVNVPADAKFTDNDTKNTAGSTDTSSKIFLVGATSQAANPQTYSHDTAYVGTDGCLYSGGTKVLTAHQDISGKVNKSGDTMTGQLKTSFKQSVAMGSYQAAAATIPNLCEELRYSSGCCGSVSIVTAYTKDGITIPTGWYNFLWVPHRSGGVNGAASGDNCNYGSLYLSGITISGCYMIRYASQAIAELKNLYKDTTYGVVSTSSNGLAPKVTDTSKFLKGDGTWATPTDTNTTYTFATGDSNGQIKVTPSGGTAQNIAVKGLGSAAYTNSGTYVYHRGNAGKSNMNDVGRLPASIGMTNLADPGNNYDNPMNGTTKATGWHLYYDACYADTPSGSNAWVSQIVNTAGTHKWWVRSRNGGTITDGTEWNAGWRHLVVSPQAGQGGTTTPIYVDANGHTQNCSYTIAKSVPSNAVFTDTNNAVTQTATTTSADYEVLFSATADNTTRTEGARKNSNLKFNPSTGNLTVTKVNGESVKYSSSVSAVVGDTTCTITDSSIVTTSLIEPFSSNSTGDTIAIKNIAVTAGQAVLTFKALTVDTSFRLRITNI